MGRAHCEAPFCLRPILELLPKKHKIGSMMHVFLMKSCVMLKVILSFLVICTCAAASFAEGRVALVMGNGAYTKALPLVNPKNDALAIADSLRKLGFDVHQGLDLDRREMVDVVRSFSSALEGADVAIFFYAGHAIQVDGRNFLIPVDAEVQSETDLDFETIELGLVLRQIERDARNAIVLLDACRDNPFRRALARSMGATRSAGALSRGLATYDMIGSSLVGYATDPGETADDGVDGHSPFTRALLAHIEEPGLDISLVLRRVRNDVLKATQNRQRPSVVDKLRETVVLVPDAPQDDLMAVAREWSQMGDTDDVRLIEAFIERFPDNPFTELAQSKLAALQSQKVQSNLVTSLQRQPIALPEPDVALQEKEVALPEPENDDLEVEAAKEPVLSKREIARAVQSELDRLGCDPGGIDGLWGKKSTRALDAFFKLADIAPLDRSPSMQVLELLKQTSDPVCQTKCSEGETLRDFACVAAEMAPSVEPKTPARQSCFTFNGVTRCN